MVLVAFICMTAGIGLLLMTKTMGTYSPKEKKDNKFHEPKNN
jgi:hypothetical protein